MDISFLGGIIPKHLEEEVIANSIKGIDAAANNLQWSIIRGLDYSNDQPIHLCNVMLVKPYPLKYKRILIKPEKFSHTQGSNDINLGFINFVGINMLSRLLAAFFGLTKWARNLQSKKVVLIYGLHTPYLLAASLIKFKYPNIRLCVYVPDLPEYMSSNKSIVYRLLKKIDKKLINWSLRSIDAVIVITKYMVDYLKVRDKQWICIEGMSKDIDIQDPINSKDEYRTILYSGSLQKRYGVLNLVQAFTQIKDVNFRLWLCGEGDASNQIIEAAKSDTRINYFGVITRSKVLDLQRRATVLVNPRTSEGEFTKYSFPSKVIEYFSSGTPTIMYKLPGVPDEYYKYCIIPDNESVFGLQMKLVEICSMKGHDLNRIGSEAQSFVLNTKNSRIQSKKILNLFSELFQSN